MEPITKEIHKRTISRRRRGKWKYGYIGKIRRTKKIKELENVLSSERELADEVQEISVETRMPSESETNVTKAAEQEQIIIQAKKKIDIQEKQDVLQNSKEILY